MEVQVNIDCAEPARLVEFYCAAFGYRPHGSEGTIYSSITADDGRPKLVFQRVPEAKAGKNRMHLDFIVGPVIESEAARLVALGATRGEQLSEFGCNWIVMHDPEGNEFCLCDS